MKSSVGLFDPNNSRLGILDVMSVTKKKLIARPNVSHF